MSVPIDRLYEFLQQSAEMVHGERVIIYRFYPHGSKNICDLNPLLPTDKWFEKTVYVNIWCNDQEPLDFEYYSLNLRDRTQSPLYSILQTVGSVHPVKNLNYNKGVYEKGLLLHSEKNSINLIKYQTSTDLIPVYYWSHALIAQDWFRYAKHFCFEKNNVDKMFLIYNRSWSGTREYRLKFADFLINHDLLNECKIFCNFIDQTTNSHYSNHTFSNPQWKPINHLENFLLSRDISSSASADFNGHDYTSTEIEVVLETLFDDSRLHLTEKSLRPMACGQPFLLVATAGSLAYLRNYGFKTFHEIWDESYDTVKDPYLRLQNVIEVMKQISNWDSETKRKNLAHAQEIAKFNQEWFLSTEFSKVIVEELINNLRLAFTELKSLDNYQRYLTSWNANSNLPAVRDFLLHNQDYNFPCQETSDQVIEICKNNVKPLTTQT